jgi:hypothetical protein
MEGRAKRRRALGVAALAALSLLCAGACVAPASAATVADRPFLFSFDGSDGIGGPLVNPNKIAVDNVTGDVYVADEPESPFEDEVVAKFDADGVATDFSATGRSTIDGPPGNDFGHSTIEGYDEVRLAVDNSGGPTQGRIYTTEARSGRLSAFAPTGALLWEIPNIGGAPGDVAVDGTGHIWVLQDNSVKEFASSGSPPAQVASCSVEHNPRSIDADASGNVYLAGFGGVDKYTGCAFVSTLDPAPTSDVYADQSSPTGRVFTSTYRETTVGFKEFDAAGTLLATFDPGGAVSAGRGIAYSKALDRVYLVNRGLDTVEAFGAPQTGTVPDPTIEAPVVAGPGTATFHGTVNPHGVPNQYYFEWAGGVTLEPFNNDNAHIFRSPSQTLPEDSVPHTVEYKAKNLQGDGPWTVRLVAINTATGLRTVSGAETFKPPKASSAPTVAIDPPTEITPTSVKVNGSLNPREDSVTLEIQIGEGDTCSEGPFRSKFAYVEGGEVSTSIPIGEEVKKLVPGQHYCVRLNAKNSFGASGPSAIEEFDTLPEPPSEVETAFVAPLADTSARLNGRVNPEGKATLKYQFEWSEDGTTWTPLPLREENVNAHEAIVVADELQGLSPGTTYHYRLAVVENESGVSAEVGAVKEFTTRTEAEVSPPGRRIELVNAPDKGDQNIFMGNTSETAQEYEVPFLSPDGERAHWSVPAGAPGSPNGVGTQFLATRTGPTESAPNGWTSASLAPPASEQFGGGSLVYNLAASTPDHTRFVMDLRGSGLIQTPEATLTRVGIEQPEEVLHSFEWSVGGEELTGIDVSDDAAHVLTVSPESHQLVDVGSGSAEVVSVMPDGTPSSCGLRGFFLGPGGAEASFVGSAQWRYGYHMMASTDANLVYFRAKPNGECGKPWGLYVRDRAAEETTLIDPGAEGRRVDFIRASPDGRLAYFVTASQLDPADGNSTADLYRWDQATEESTCLTCVVPNADIAPVGEGTTPILVSDDLSHAYFSSHNRLVPGEGITGGENLYVLSGGQIRFVATPALISGGVLRATTSSLAADGNVLLFRSADSAGRRLTADPIDCASPCPQLYRYDDRDGSVECLTCAPAGTTMAPLGIRANLVSNNGFTAMSADGSTVAFLTEEPLAPLDVNGAADVYEWRGGERRLITDGVSSTQSGFARPGAWGIDANGDNILFSVVEPGLTGFEQDHFANLYDARIGGGFEPPAPPKRCQEDSCQGPLVPPPTAERPTSPTYSGAGNVKPPGSRRPCPKGRTRHHGHCLKKHSKRHHKKRHRGAGARQGESR